MDTRKFSKAVAIFFTLACSAPFSASPASGIQPGEYVGEVCWHGQFTQFRSIHNPQDIISAEGTEFLISLQASYAGGGIYNLVGYLWDSGHPKLLIPKTARAHLVEGNLYYQMMISSAGIYPASKESDFIDWLDTNLPEGLHWTTGGDLNGHLGRSRKTVYYVFSTGQVISHNASQQLEPTDFMPVNPHTGRMSNVDCGTLYSP